MKKKNYKSLIGLIILILAIILAIVATITILHGNTSIISENVSNTKSTALQCKSNEIAYPIFTYDKSDEKELKIDMVFNGTEGPLKTIALSYTLFYNDKSLIHGSESANHADMNLSFYNSGLKADEFNAKYTKLENAMRLNLYASENAINHVSAKYFLLDNTNKLPTGLSEYQESYTKRGLICKEQ